MRLRKAVAALRSAVDDYGRHACSELAAAIAYRILFSLVPFVALLAACSAPARERARRRRRMAARRVPGHDRRAAASRRSSRPRARRTSLAGLVAFGTLIWTASGMTRSLRVALAVVWEIGRAADVRAREAARHRGARRPRRARAGRLRALAGHADRRPGRRRPHRRARVSAARRRVIARSRSWRSPSPPRSPRCWSSTGSAPPSRRPLAARLAERAGDRGRDRRRRRGLRVLPRPDRQLRHDLRAAGRGARVPRAGLHDRLPRRCSAPSSSSPAMSFVAAAVFGGMTLSPTPHRRRRSPCRCSTLVPAACASRCARPVTARSPSRPPDTLLIDTSAMRSVLDRSDRPDHGARRAGRHVGRRDRGRGAVRAGARVGHARDGRRHRLHARRRARVPRAQARLRRRQSAPRRRRHRRRRAADRARGSSQRPVLGAARGGRELRRRDRRSSSGCTRCARSSAASRDASIARSRRTCWSAFASTRCPTR